MEANNVTFTNDILPMLVKWRSQMIWRLDLAKYEDVKMNKDVIWGQISSGSMPPPPFPPYTNEQIAVFKQWMDNDCPE